MLKNNNNILINEEFVKRLWYFWYLFIYDAYYKMSFRDDYSLFLVILTREEKIEKLELVLLIKWHKKVYYSY